MDTHTQATEGTAPWFNPLTGWEAASRWNAATFDWMAKGFQQWLAIVTTMPRSLVIPASFPATPAPAGAQDARAARSSHALGSRLRGNDEGKVHGKDEVHALAQSEPRRPARAKATPAARKKATRARTRG